MVYVTFYKHYKIDLLKDNISFKSYQLLLNNLPSDCDLMKIISLRSMEDYEIKDPKLLKYKRSLSLEKNKEDSLKQFASIIRGDQ